MGAIFDDGKDAGALRTIGEVGEALGIKAHVLRYWEGQFPMLQPLKRSGGRRYYRAEDVALVQEIDRLVNREGYTLRGAKAALKGFDTHQRVSRASDEHLPGTIKPTEGSRHHSEAEDRTELIGKLKAIRSTLAQVLSN